MEEVHQKGGRWNDPRDSLRWQNRENIPGEYVLLGVLICVRKNTGRTLTGVQQDVWYQRYPIDAKMANVKRLQEVWNTSHSVYGGRLSPFGYGFRGFPFDQRERIYIRGGEPMKGSILGESLTLSPHHDTGGIKVTHLSDTLPVWFQGWIKVSIGNLLASVNPLEGSRFA